MKPTTVYRLVALAGASNALVLPIDSLHGNGVVLPETQDGVFGLSYDENNQAVITTINLNSTPSHKTTSPPLSPFSSDSQQKPLHKKRDAHPIDLPIKPHNFGCRSEAWKQLDSIADYTSARNLLADECNAGHRIPLFNIMWVRKGTSYAYACNYNEHPTTCSGAELEAADDILNRFCPQVSEEVALRSTGWVHIPEWKKTYGRGKYGDVICGNLPMLEGPTVPKVGETEAVAIGRGDCKKIGRYLEKVEKWDV